MHKKSGFTLLEILVVVLIIGILAAVAMPVYNRAIERMRIAEADATMATIVGSQERFRIQRSRYTRNWQQLDVSPNAVHNQLENNPYFNDEKTVYYTNGTSQKINEDKESIPPGYKIYFQEGTKDTWFIIAERIGWARYNYILIKEFGHDLSPKKTICLPGSYSDDKRVCMDYMGIDDESDIPSDPRTGV